MKSSCFLQRCASDLRKWPSLLLSCSVVGWLGWLRSGFQGGPKSTAPPRVTLSKWVDKSLWGLSEMTYLRQLALTKYLIHFTAALQKDCGRLISWWHLDSNTIYLGFSPPWQWDRKIFLKLIKNYNKTKSALVLPVPVVWLAANVAVVLLQVCVWSLSSGFVFRVTNCISQSHCLVSFTSLSSHCRRMNCRCLSFKLEAPKVFFRLLITFVF